MTRERHKWIMKKNRFRTLQRESPIPRFTIVKTIKMLYKRCKELLYVVFFVSMYSLLDSYIYLHFLPDECKLCPLCASPSSLPSSRLSAPFASAWPHFPIAMERKAHIVGSQNGVVTWSDALLLCWAAIEKIWDAKKVMAATPRNT